jgi:exonuclease III
LGQGVLTTEHKRGQDNRELSKDANEEGSKNEGPKVKALDDKYLNDNNAQPDEGNEESILCWQGIDVWRAMKPDIRRFTYFPRTREWGSSCDRVDYVLTSKKLWDTGRVSDAGILDNEAERGPSDHVPIWVDINLKNITPQEQGKAG